VITLAIRAPMPAPGKPRFGWAKRKRAKVRAGCYETDGPVAREVYVAEQVGEIVGWRYARWEGTEPVEVVYYVRVQELPRA
jgi:hypothetical protein